jgi:hypothetical protein
LLDIHIIGLKIVPIDKPPSLPSRIAPVLLSALLHLVAKKVSARVVFCDNSRGNNLGGDKVIVYCLCFVPTILVLPYAVRSSACAGVLFFVILVAEITWAVTKSCLLFMFCSDDSVASLLSILDSLRLTFVSKFLRETLSCQPYYLEGF